jgi:hypothetical protein
LRKEKGAGKRMREKRWEGRGKKREEKGKEKK